VSYQWNQSEAPFEPIDQAVKVWEPVVVPIFVNSKKSSQAVDGVGTAYLITTGPNLYLVTALHVLETANKSTYKIANIQGKAVSLGGLSFKISKQCDVAVAHLSNAWLTKAGLGEDAIKALPLITDTSWSATGIFLLLGYPAKKNEIDGRYGKLTRYLFSITATGAEGKSVATKVKNPIFFEYDHKNAVNSQLVNLGEKAAMYGMSGGPALELLKKHRNGEFVFSVSCAGVLCDWFKATKTVVASSMANVKQLITRYEDQFTGVIQRPLD
jgi:hypothetical protein